MIKLTHKLNTCKKEHEFFENNHVCPTCTQELSEEFRSEKLEAGQSKVDEMNVGYDDLQKANSDEQERFNKFTELSTEVNNICLLYTSPSPRDRQKSRMPSSA